MWCFLQSISAFQDPSFHAVTSRCPAASMKGASLRKRFPQTEIQLMWLKKPKTCILISKMHDAHLKFGIQHLTWCVEYSQLLVFWARILYSGPHPCEQVDPEVFPWILKFSL